ncbi:hypothetical protein CPC16_004596 [Podila verticillata]|nr:hypothetical protein CPC16_004596 [Podila verticillata]
MTSLSSDDFNIFGSMEAQAHVYLEALAKMKSPLKQIELEAEVLDSIWTVLQGGKRQMSPDGGFYFLSKDQMLEYGLDSAFKERIDMATFTHETLVSQLDWTRIQQSLRDFEQVFLQQPKVTDDGDEPELLIETFLYLITMALALAAKKRSRSKKNVTVANIQPFCNRKNIPAIGTLEGANMAPLIKLAADLVNDKDLFTAMHNDTWKHITTIIQRRLHRLGPPPDSGSYDVVSTEHEEEVKRIYVGKEAQKLRSQKVRTKKWLQDDALKARYIQPDRSNEVDEEDEEIIKEEERNHEEGRQENDKGDRTEHHDHEDDHEDGSAHQDDHRDLEEDLNEDQEAQTPAVVKRTDKGKGKQLKSTTPVANVDAIDVDDTFDGISPVSKGKTTAKSRESAPKRTNQKANERSGEPTPSRRSRSRPAKPTYQLVPQRFGSEEFEGGDDIPPPPPSKKRRVVSDDADAYVTDPEDEVMSQSVDTEGDDETNQTSHQYKAKKTAVQRCVCGGCTCEGVQETRKPGRPRKTLVASEGDEASSSSGPKERKKNRAWTSDEVSTLERLASMPQFRHDPEEQHGKKRQRKIRWAALKKYDASHGNILQHRNQIQLKDKHRDLNDDGEHYRLVQEINKRKQTPQLQLPAETSRRL